MKYTFRSIAEQDELFFVPEAECDILETMCIGNTSDAIFTPSEGSRSGMFVREI
jgi:hypothetical protein